jgi:predicted O-methyltransferase YrrM
MIKYPGLLDVVKRRIKLSLLGDRDGVSLNYLAKTTNGIFTDIQSLILAERELPKEMLKHLPKSQMLFTRTIEEQSRVTNSRWNAEQQLFTLLYALVISKNPDLVVETGVANGISTNAIMKALEKSKKSGTLHSFDVLPETSKAYRGNGNWKFHLLNMKKAHTQLIDEIQHLAKPELWLHDSNHAYRWQKFEFLLAIKSLRSGGILISDDIDASPAWAELAGTVFRKSYIIFDSRKFIGIAFK